MSIGTSSATGNIVREEKAKARDRAINPIDPATGEAPAKPKKARKPKAAKDPKTARAAAAHKVDRKKAAKAPARAVPQAVKDAENGAPTRTFAIRITTAQLDAIHRAAGPRGASRAAKAVMEAFAAHDGRAFAAAVKAAKANGGSSK